MLVTEKSLHDKLDEITFFQYLLKEDIYHELKDISETTYARIGMQQRNIRNLQHRMHASEVARERLKNQWSRGDESIRSFIGTWFQMSKDEVDTCIQPSGHFDHYQTKATSKVKLNDYNKALSGRQPTIRYFLQLYLFYVI